MNQELKEKLTAEIIWTGTKQGSFQRAHIYNPEINVTNKEKEKLRNHIKEFCFNNLYKSSEEITEEKLLEIISKLSKTTEDKYKRILKNGKFQFGNSQKFVNIYLKLLWVLEKVNEPPHFPVDRIIQKGFKPIRNWTNMNKDEYLEVIDKAKNKAKNSKLSLANWEAKKYDELTN